VPYRRAAVAYLEMTGLQNYGGEYVAAANHGLKAFYAETARADPAFSASVEEFYRRVAAHDARRRPEDPKPSLARAAGQGADAAIAPGWAWTEALDVARGDPDRAMRLIGFCGHDDAQQTQLDKPRSPEAARAAMEAERRRLESEIAVIRRRLAPGGKAAAPSAPAPGGALSLAALSDSPDELRLQLAYRKSRLAKLRLEDFRVEAADVCPPANSAFYLPRSLDRDADIPQPLKQRIADAQKEGRLESLPAKYYHVLGSAATACEMIRGGAPGWAAGLVEREAAWMYRALRMNIDAEAYAIRRIRLQKDYAAYRSALPPGEAPLDEEAFRSDWNEKAAAKDPAARVSLSHMDAYELMELWGYFGRPFPYLGMPRLPLDHSTNWLEGRFFRPKPESWSDERFSAARKRMETFFVDTEWTVAEHAAGAAFAAKVCREEPAAAQRPGF
jgi:hypothetical protein